MAYTINKSNGGILTTISDQIFDVTSTALTLVGRGAVNYGPAFDENFVYLMENFANGIAPAKPLVGQLWYDTANNLMKVYTSGRVLVSVLERWRTRFDGRNAPGHNALRELIWWRAYRRLDRLRVDKSD